MSNITKYSLALKLLKEIVDEYIANIEKLQIESEQFVRFITRNHDINNNDVNTIIDNLILSHKRLFILSHKFRAEFSRIEEEYSIMSTDSFNQILDGLDIHLDILKHTQEKMELIIKRKSKK